jgi:hypothetical protein
MSKIWDQAHKADALIMMVESWLGYSGNECLGISNGKYSVNQDHVVPI